MGKISREARLCFIELWTLADDSGRLRGTPKVLASLLYPYDDDAAGLIDGWLAELEGQGCITRYEVEGKPYIAIQNWLSHQKIDKPTPSRLPAPAQLTTEPCAPRSERDMETEIVAALQQCKTFLGGEVVDVARQVRVGSFYLDIVVTTTTNKFVFELKKDRLTIADLRQVLRYAELMGGIPVLIGSGFSPRFPVDECRKSGVAVMIANEHSVALKISSPAISECYLALGSARECYLLDQGPRTKDLGKDQGESPLSNGEASDELEFDFAEDEQASEKLAAVKAVFAYYLQATSRSPTLYTFTKLRRNKGLARLNEGLRKARGNLEDAKQLMLAAVDELVASDWHMGRHPDTGGKRYCEWEKHLFGSAEQFEKWLMKAEEGDVHG